MKRISTVLVAGVAALLVVLPSGAARAAPRYAVVNVGPSDYDTAQGLLTLYGVLTPASAALPAL